ncbi:hypothetical protein [Ammonifex degensii]|uniref:hypothetical protein n=1 Tax=Ammonifex degensii TaxID=42838 RepID=UPI00031A77DA|nr:hypothetical protein [Ammonifex degensii]
MPPGCSKELWVWRDGEGFVRKEVLAGGRAAPAAFLAAAWDFLEDCAVLECWPRVQGEREDPGAPVRCGTDECLLERMRRALGGTGRLKGAGSRERPGAFGRKAGNYGRKSLLFEEEF